MARVKTPEDLCIHLKHLLEKKILKLFDDGYWLSEISFDEIYKQIEHLHYCPRCGDQIYFGDEVA